MAIGVLGAHGQIVHRKREPRNVLGRGRDIVTTRSPQETESIVLLMEVPAKSSKNAIATQQVEYLICMRLRITCK